MVDSVGPDDEVYRRLAPDTVDRHSNAVTRNAFYTSGKPDAEISVHVKRLSGSVDETLQRAERPRFGMGLLRVSEVQALGFEVEHRPLPADASHAVILGATSRMHCDQLAELTEILKWPDGVAASS